MQRPFDRLVGEREPGKLEEERIARTHMLFQIERVPQLEKVESRAGGFVLSGGDRQFGRERWTRQLRGNDAEPLTPHAVGHGQGGGVTTNERSRLERIP